MGGITAQRVLQSAFASFPIHRTISISLRLVPIYVTFSLTQKSIVCCESQLDQRVRRHFETTQ
jgi:hypothetical protein